MRIRWLEPEQILEMATVEQCARAAGQEDASGKIRRTGFQADLIALPIEDGHGEIIFGKIISWSETVPWMTIVGRYPAPPA